MLLLLGSIVAFAADCPDGSAPATVESVQRCERQEGDTVAPIEGWWARSSADGVLGETRYEAGLAVEGLDGPPGRPRCLAQPPPDGLYGLPDPTVCAGTGGCDPILVRPVAIVGGCVGTTTGDAWTHQVGLAGHDRFLAVDSDGKRCDSGRTAEYVAATTGLTGRVHVWTRCGGGIARAGDPVDLARTEAVAAGDSDALLAAFEHPEEAVRAAALEAIAARETEDWTCEPLGRAIRGGLGSEAAARAVELAHAACLADPLRVALFDHKYTPAADALAALVDAPDAIEADLVHVAREGMVWAVAPLAARLAALGAPSPTLRDTLGALVLDREGDDDSRQATVATLDRLFREPDDGAALIAKGDTHLCVGWHDLLGTAAVKAYVDQAPPRAVRKIESVRARCE